MIAGLHDDPRAKQANIALMKISTYLKQEGFEPKLNANGIVNYCSCIWDKSRHHFEILADSLKNVQIGGPGWDESVKLPDFIEKLKPDYDLYGIDYGIGKLTEGCPGGCPWCKVPRMEGKTVRTVNTLENIINPRSNFVILQDPNILASPDLYDIFREIKMRGLRVNFNQGLDITFIDDFKAKLLKTIRIRNWTDKTNQIHFAFDKPEKEAQIRRGMAELIKAGIKPYRIRFYILCGFDTDFEQDLDRFKLVKELGAEPYIMKYQGQDEGRKEYSNFERKRLDHFGRYINAKAGIWRKQTFDEYEPWIKAQKEAGLI